MKDLFSEEIEAPAPPEAAPPAATRGRCPACTKAAVRLWGQFLAGCAGCAARGIARGPNYRRRMAVGYPEWRYTAELEAAKLTHEDVTRAAAADFEIVNKGRPS